MGTESDLHAHILQPQPITPTQLLHPSEAFTPGLTPGVLSRGFDRLELIEKDRPPAQKGSAYLGLSQLELEVTDLDRSENFYQRVFGLKSLGREKDALGRETGCLQLHSGQWLVLHKVNALNERSSANYRFEGQHYAFFTPTAETLQQFRQAVAREGGKVDALEQTQVRSATAHGLYFTDFDGNPLQLQVEGSE